MTSITPNRIFITGINGFIASHLAEYALSNNVAVKGLCRRPSEVNWLSEKGVEVVSGDLFDISVINNAVVNCDVVIHAAGWSGNAAVSPDMAWKTNVDGTANVIAAAKAAGVKRLVYISSVAVYGINKSRLLDESALTPLLNELYPDSKITAEGLIKTSGIPYVIIRPGSTYGPRGEGWTIGVINQIKSGFKLQGNDQGIVTPGYISNFVDGTWLAVTLENALNQTFNICDNAATTYKEFYSAYAKMLGIESLPTIPQWRVSLSRSKLFTVLRKLLKRPEGEKWATQFRFNPSQYSVKRAETVLGYKPKVKLAEGLKKTEVWLKTNGYI